MDIGSLLKSIDMEDKKNKFPAELSGGEQQRVSIARAIVKNPDILLFDEPTGALDYQTSKEILKLIEKINNEFKTTMLIITHNSAIGAMTDRIVKLRSGEIIQAIDNKNKAAAGEVEW
jgi:putative ABC transport system ATP-binding protein